MTERYIKVKQKDFCKDCPHERLLLQTDFDTTTDESHKRDKCVVCQCIDVCTSLYDRITSSTEEEV